MTVRAKFIGRRKQICEQFAGFHACRVFSFLLAIASIIVLPLVFSPFGFGSLTEALARIARWPVLLLVLLIGLAVLYRYGPDRRAARWQWVTVGSVSAAVTWIVASFLFSWYLSNFANYNATYGSLGAAVGVMVLVMDFDDRDAAWRRAQR